MKNDVFIIEEVYPAPVHTVWKALTDKDEMKVWYFDLPDFRPEVGCEFQFWGGPAEDRQYHHICRVTEVVADKKIAYTWRYEGHQGNTLVTFELFDEGLQTKLKLTHEGLDTFPADNPDLAKTNFVQGWTWIIGTALKEYLEKTVHE